MHKTINTALLALSAKPFHTGHFSLIEKAARECDSVQVYTSLTDRKSDGFIVKGTKMSKIWYEHILSHLPQNVQVYFVKNPLQAVVTVLQGRYPYNLHVYCGADRAHKFELENLPITTGKFTLHAIDRNDCKTSGTLIRKALASNDFKSFQEHMPGFINAFDVWQILTK